MNQIENFWKWFLENHGQLKTLHTLTNKQYRHYVFWLKWHLNYYAKGLDAFIPHPRDNNEISTLIITAHGNPGLYDKVEEVVRLAPKLKNWTITAFIPPCQYLDEVRQGLDMPYEYDGLSIKLSDLKCMPVPDPDYDIFHLIVYLNDFSTLSENESLFDLILLMLQDLLGEKSFYKNIDLVHLEDMLSEESDCMIPLHQLQDYIDKCKSQVNHSEQQHLANN